MKIKVAVSTLGCKVNQCDSAYILENLDDSHFSIVPYSEKADCYIINTCTVTHLSDYQSRQMIRRAIRKNPEAIIIVTGCYAQVARDEIKRIPGVHHVFGNNEKKDIPFTLLSIFGKEAYPRAKETYSSHPRFTTRPLKHHRSRTRAFLKIQDGCNNVCSYCIVPLARGKSRSLPESEVITLIGQRAFEEYREIVLTGIHLGMYGLDLTPPSSLYKILEHVEKNQIIERMRLSSIEVGEITDDMIQLIAHGITTCPHLHIPLQSGDDSILRAMNRHYDRSYFTERVKKIADSIPDIAIGLDVMIGFPGEGEEEFFNTVKCIEELPVAYLHVFPYSDRPGTESEYLPNKVEHRIKKKRAELVRDLGRRKREEFALRQIGRTLSVLLEGECEGGFMRGLSRNYLPVIVERSHATIINTIVDVHIETWRDGKLFGRITHNGS